jgi:hypothetical protein
MNEKKKLTLRQQGDRLNAEGRLSPLEAMQQRLEFHIGLAKEEQAKGIEGSREKISSHLKAAQEAAEALAPYRHPRLQAAAVTHSASGDLAELLRILDGTSTGLTARVPQEETKH